VTHTQIKAANYNLLAQTYAPRAAFKLVDSTWEVKKLSEVCEFKNGKSITRAELTPGDYPVVGGGQSPLGTHNKFNKDENVILCSSTGDYSGFISQYNKKIWASDCFSIHPNKNLLNTYLFYYLKYQQELIYKLQHGATHKHINGTDISTIDIPICSFEKQIEIVKQCETYDAQITQLNETVESIKKSIRVYGDMSFQVDDKHMKKLGDVCEIYKGSRLTKSDIVPGEYPVISHGKHPIGYHNKFNEGPNTIICATAGTPGYISIYDHKVWVSDCFIIKQKSLINKYVYYYLKHIEEYLHNLSRGAIQLNLNLTDINNVNIPVIELEKQQEIINQFDDLHKLITLMKKMIEQINELKKNYLSQFFKVIASQDQIDHQSVEPA
jgi:restriction endonuclease S subunit